MGAVTRPWRRRHLGTEADRATFRTLHSASLASPALREGLTKESAERSIRHLHDLLGSSPALALTDTADAARLARRRAAPRGAVPGARGRDRRARQHPDVRPRRPAVRRARLRDPTAIVSPLVVEERVVGTLQVVRRRTRPPVWPGPPTRSPSGSSAQLELAELDASRTRLMEAEVRALRAQISPHFIYNSLGAIASFVRTDPDRARELLLEFADFTRYSFRRHGEYTTLAEELRSVERYLLLEQARFGDRLQVTLRIAPEVLPVAVPFLCIQPLVENAVRHGLESAEGGGHIRIVARDQGQECVIEVEDDGAGEDPGRRTARARRRHARSTRSGSATSTAGCATRSATTSGWSSRPRRAPAPRSSSGSRSSPRGCTHDT